MKTTHNTHISGSQEETEPGIPSCGGWRYCTRCRAEFQVWARAGDKNRQYVFLIAAREYLQLSGETPEEAKDAFTEMYKAGIISAQLCVEVQEYLDGKLALRGVKKNEGMN